MQRNTKEWIQYASAVGMLVSGVLWYVAQCLVYAGSIFGVTMYIHSKWGEVKNYIDENVQPKAKKDEKD